MKRRVECEDIVRYKLIEQDISLSPDAKTVAYALKEADLEKNGYKSSIWSQQTAGGAPKKLTAGPVDESPVWSPDGEKLAYVSNRTGEKQIWILHVNSGEEKQLTDISTGASGPVWSPDGQKIAFTSRTHAPNYVKPKADVRIIEMANYKTMGGFRNDKYAHLCVVEVATGEMHQLTEGTHDNTSPAWSPDSSSIAFVSRRTEDWDLERAKDIWLVQLANKTFQQVTEDHEGSASAPTFSPCGTEIVFIGHDNHRPHGMNNMVFMSVNVQGGKPTPLYTADVSLGNDVLYDMTYFTKTQPPSFSPDGMYVYGLATLGGACHVIRLNRESGCLERVTAGDRLIYAYSLDRSCNSLAFVASEPTIPGDLYLQSIEGSNYTCVQGYKVGTSFEQDNREDVRLTDVNEQLVSGLNLVEQERITYKGPDDWDIEGWILKPVDFDESKKYPLVLYIHGGPACASGYAYFHEMQLLAAQGWVVLLPNPRGSRGYGEDFADAVIRDWGGKDYLDIMAGVDHVLSLGFVDENNMACAGGSYGGFMTNLIVGRTQRFKVACTQRSVASRLSYFGSSDAGFNLPVMYGDVPWKAPEKYLKFSPIMSVGNVSTPLLIIHSENDQRCPMEQAEQLFAALRVRKQKVIFCRYSGEDHNLSRTGKPINRIDRLERIVNWFKDYLDK